MMTGVRDDIRVFQTYYDAGSLGALEPGFLGYHHDKCNCFFESQAICDIFDQRFEEGSVYFGIVGPSLRNKVAGWPFDFRRFMLEDEYRHDCYYFRTYPEPPWHQGEQYHGRGFVAAAQIACRRAGISLDLLDLGDRCPPIYCNYQVCRTSWYRLFVNSVLRPFVERALDTPEMNVDARYENGLLSREDLMRICGYPFYTLHAFVAERLFPTFVAAHQLTCIALEPKIGPNNK